MSGPIGFFLNSAEDGRFRRRHHFIAGSDATDFRPEHGPNHVHLGSNDGPRVRADTFGPFSDADEKRLSKKTEEFCKELSDGSKEKIQKRQLQVFQYGKAVLQRQGMGLLSVAATCRADPVWCLEQLEQGVIIPP